ncbi:MAG: universal stress protein [Marinirhabdus sp.]
MYKILVPTDFSPQATQALGVALQLADKFNGEIYLLHSLEMPLHLARSGDTGTMPESLYYIKLAEKRFLELFENLATHIAIQQTIGHGEIYDDINEVVEKNGIDLIVMGSHGSSGFREMFIGSNTEKVVRTANIPVMVIKNEHTDFEVTDFVFSTDFSDEYRKPFENALRFAKSINAYMHLLYINTPKDFKTTAQIDALANRFVKNIVGEEFSINVYNDTAVEKGILNFAQSNNAQLIGISTHGRSGLAHFFNGSISEDIVNHANMPIITFKI